MPKFLDDTLRRRVVFVTGKGGVGKSLVSCALACMAQRHGKSTVRVTWNSFEKSSLGGHSQPIRTIVLDPLSSFHEYALRILKFEKIYTKVFDNNLFKKFFFAAPGISEVLLAGKVWDLYSKKEADLIVVDLPSSGHALSFFKSPLGIEKLFPVGFVRKEASKIISLFGGPDGRLDLVSIPEDLSVRECQEIKEALDKLHPFSYGFLILNRCLPQELPLTLETKDTTFQPYWDQFRRMRTQETEALQALQPLKMDCITLPYLSSPSAERLIEKLSFSMEGE